MAHAIDMRALQWIQVDLIGVELQWGEFVACDAK